MKIYINCEKLYVHFRWKYSEEEEEADSVIDKLKEILKSVTSEKEKDEKLCIDMISAWNDVISKIEQAKVRKWYHFFRSENYDIEKLYDLPYMETLSELFAEAFLERTYILDRWLFCL